MLILATIIFLKITPVCFSCHKISNVALIYVQKQSTYNVEIGAQRYYLHANLLFGMKKKKKKLFRRIQRKSDKFQRLAAISGTAGAMYFDMQSIVRIRNRCHCFEL